MQIDTELRNLYLKFRQHSPFMLVGHNAKLAMDSAKTLLEFRQLESAGLVRMRCEPETENYFHVYGEPEPRRGQTQKQATKELEALLERDGVWWTVSEWFDGDEWQHADSCGMHTGYKDPLSPFENCYIIQEMQAAIDALRKHQADLITEETESFSAACADIATVS